MKRIVLLPFILAPFYSFTQDIANLYYHQPWAKITSLKDSILKLFPGYVMLTGLNRPSRYLEVIYTLTDSVNIDRSFGYSSTRIIDAEKNIEIWAQASPDSTISMVRIAANKNNTYKFYKKFISPSGKNSVYCHCDGELENTQTVNMAIKVSACINRYSKNWYHTVLRCAYLDKLRAANP